MKILFLCHALNSGGAERVCTLVANGLAQLGHEVSILTDTSSFLAYPPDSRVELISSVTHCGRFRTRIKSFMQLYSLLKTRNFEVVVSILCHNMMYAKVASMLTNHCLIVQSEHNAYERPNNQSLRAIQKLQKFWFSYFVDAVTVLTEADKRVLNGRFKHVYVMPNPLALKPVIQLPNKQKNVLAVGRIDDWECKGFDLLISAWNRIGINFPAWKLKIIGAGTKENILFLKGMVQRSSQVEFMPFTTSIQDEYRRAEIFVLSSRYEGFGLVLTEAMSQGCACIAADYKGRQSEIVTDGVNGLVCQTNSVDSLAEKLTLLLSDDKLRSLIAKNAPMAMDKYSVASIAERWDWLLKSRVQEKLLSVGLPRYEN